MFIEATSEIASRITGAIREAARATGASFDYLLKTALRESNLDPTAKAGTSSATGLFQFIDQTWLETVKSSGAELGYGRYADAIAQNSSGRYVVPDAAMRQEIMQLRNDPAASAAMAAAFTQRNASMLTAKLGRKPTGGELYIAHFLGPSGAGQLISTASAAPQTKAADLFPEAARANRSIFYSRTGGARSTAEVYGLLVGKHDNMRMPPGLSTGTQVAAVAAPAAAGRFGTVTAASFAATNDTGADAPTARLVVTPAFAPGDGPVFHSLFQSDRRGPVSQVVSELWGAKSVQFPDRARSAVPAAAGAASTPPARPLDLFQFLRPDVRGRDNPAA